MSNVQREIRVQRTRIAEDGSRSQELVSYQVPVNKRTTVLDALEYIRSELEPDLLYRHSCHHGSCGTCGMLINNAQKLACLTAIEEVSDDVVEVRALSTMNHIADLAVDPAPLFADFPRHATYLRESEASREAVPPEEIERFSRFEDCIECGLCVNSCPVTRRFMGPAALAAYRREIINRPERRDELLAEVDQEHGAWACDRALNCSRVCPTGVYPAKHIALLQRELEDSESSAGGKSGEGA